MKDEIVKKMIEITKQKGNGKKRHGDQFSINQMINDEIKII